MGTQWGRKTNMVPILTKLVVLDWRCMRHKQTDVYLEIWKCEKKHKAGRVMEVKRVFPDEKPAVWGIGKIHQAGQEAAVAMAWLSERGERGGTIAKTHSLKTLAGYAKAFLNFIQSEFKSHWVLFSRGVTGSNLGIINLSTKKVMNWKGQEWERKTNWELILAVKWNRMVNEGGSQTSAGNRIIRSVCAGQSF